MSASSPLPDAVQFPAIDPGQFRPVPPATRVSHAYLCAIGGWTFRDLPASQSDVPLARVFCQPGGTVIAVDQSYIAMPRPGSILSLSVTSFEARTAGTATFEILKSGAATGITCALDAVTTQFAWSNPAVTTGFNPGDYLNVRVTTDAGWTPATADVEATIWLLMKLPGGGMR